MFLDTNFNSPNTVLSTIYQNFVEASMKYYRYAKCMTKSFQPDAKLLIGRSCRKATNAANLYQASAYERLVMQVLSLISSILHLSLSKPNTKIVLCKITAALSASAKSNGMRPQMLEFALHYHHSKAPQLTESLTGLRLRPFATP